MNLENDYRQLRRQHDEALRYLAILVERAGGEVLLLPADLMHDRQLSKQDEVTLGTVRLTAKRL
jgi:hypothetical protein